MPRADLKATGKRDDLAGTIEAGAGRGRATLAWLMGAPMAGILAAGVALSPVVAPSVSARRPAIGAAGQSRRC